MAVVDKEGLRNIIAALTPFSNTATEWAVDPNRFVGDQDRGLVQLTLLGIEALGVDEHRRAFGPPGYLPTDFVTTEIGQRDVTIQIYAEVYDTSVEAQEILDIIRTGIRAERVRDQLNALNLALQWMTKTTVLKATRNERALSAATADVSLGGINSVTAVEHDEGWIDTVNGGSTIPGTITT